MFHFSDMCIITLRVRMCKSHIYRKLEHESVLRVIVASSKQPAVRRGIHSGVTDGRAVSTLRIFTHN